MLSLKVQNRLDQAWKTATMLLRTTQNENVKLGAIRLQIEATKTLIDFVGPLKNETVEGVRVLDSVVDTLANYEEAMKEALYLNCGFLTEIPNLNGFSEQEKLKVTEAYNIVMSHRKSHRNGENKTLEVDGQQ